MPRLAMSRKALELWLAAGNQSGCNAVLQPIVPARRAYPFDDPAWLFDLKLDGFRGLADTIAGRMLSKNGNRLKRYESLLDALPPGFVLDGEIVALDGGGRSVFNNLLFGRRQRSTSRSI
jgi:bifunctional non-homologous end joining protein LigD